MKALIIDMRSLHDEPRQEPHRTHNLNSLWSECRDLLERIEPLDADVRVGVDHIVAEVNRLDPVGDGFRYPIDAKGNLTLYETDHISFPQISSGMAPVANFFESAWNMVQRQVNFRAEMESYYEEYCGDGGDMGSTT